MKLKVCIFCWLFFQSCFLQGQDTIYALVPEEGLKVTQITQVELNEDFTILKMKVFLPDYVHEIPVYIAPPNATHAMYLEVAGKKYKLLKSEGIAVFPEKMNTSRKSNNEFSLYFEPLPEGVYIFDFIEPMIPGEDNSEPFTYRNVMLSRSPTRLVSLRFLTPKDFNQYLKKSKKLLESYWTLKTDYHIVHKKNKTTEALTFPTDTLVTIFEDEVYKFYFLNGFLSTNQFFYSQKERRFFFKRTYLHKTWNEIPFRMRDGNFQLEINIPNEEAAKILNRKISRRYEVYKTIVFKKLDFPKKSKS